MKVSAGDAVVLSWKDTRRCAQVAVIGIVVVLVMAALAGSARASAQPAGLWHFDEGSGTTVTDNSGNGHRGSVAGATWIPGQPGFGEALSFPGTAGAGVTIPVQPSGSSLEPHAAVSVSAWVRHLGSPGAYRYVVAKGATAVAASYALYTGARGGLQFYVSNDPGQGFGASQAAAADQVWDGNWHLVVGTWDGSAVRLYVDGTEVGQATPYRGPLDYPGGTSNALFIAQYPLCQDSAFGGDVDEAAVWDQALSPSDVRSLLAGPYEAPSSNIPSSGQGQGPGGSTAQGQTMGGHGSGGGNRPVLSNLTMSPALFAVHAAARGRSRRSRKGTVVSYRDNETAESIFTVLARRAGVVRGGRCVRPPARRHGKHLANCVLFVPVGSFTRADHAGRNTFAFNGVVGRRPLAPGKYRLAARPAAQGLIGLTVTTAFRILP